MENKFRSLMDENIIKMTPDERLEAYTRGEEIDVWPFTLFDIEYVYGKSLGYSKNKLRQDNELWLDIVRIVNDVYKFDSTGVGLDQKTVGIALGTKTYLNAQDDMLISDYVLEDYKDLDKIRGKNIKDSEIFKRYIDRLLFFKENAPDLSLWSAINGPFTTASAIRPIEKLLRDTRKNKDELLELLDIATGYTLDWLDLVVEKVGKIPVSISDGMSSLNVLAEKQYMSFVAPFLERQINGIYEKTGYKPTVHICGTTKAIWPYLSCLNISGFSVDNCESIEELKDIMGPHKMIIGNIDPVSILLNGSPEDVDQAVKKALSLAGSSENGLVVAPGCSLAEDTPIENINSMVEALAKYKDEFYKIK